MATDAFKESAPPLSSSYQLKGGGKPADMQEGFPMETTDYRGNENFQGASGGSYGAADYQNHGGYYDEGGEFDDYGDNEYYGDEENYGDYEVGVAQGNKNIEGHGKSVIKEQDMQGGVQSNMQNVTGTTKMEADYKGVPPGGYGNDYNFQNKSEDYGEQGYEDESNFDNDGDESFGNEEDFDEEGDVPEEAEDADEEEYDSDESKEDESDDDDDAEESEDEALNNLGSLETLMEEEEPAENSQASTEEPSSSMMQPDEPLPPEDPGTAESGKEGQTKKRKRRKKKETSGDDKDKPKRKRKKRGEKTEDGDKKKVAKHARKNIRKILSENKLEQETLDAQQAELERQRRLSDLKKQQMGLLQMSMVAEKEAKKEKDSQLKSLLQAAEEDADKEDKETDKKETPKKKEGVIDISSGEEDEDCVMVPSEEEEDDEEEPSDLEDYAEAEDVNNSGSHINDEYNRADATGRVLVNVGHPTSDPDIFLSSLVATYIKPHQIGGVRFLYDNLVECINRFKTSSGFGCILAHSMGLGKTIQMIGFTDIFLKHTGARTVMVIVPINTLANWMSEFNMWVPEEKLCREQNYPEDVKPRPYQVYILNDLYKTTPARAKVIEEWYKTGGVLLIGYEMYRLLSSKKVHLQKAPKRRKTANSSEVIDVEEEDRDKKLLVGMHEALVCPGPDLVVCDEGHRIKNSHAGISQSLKLIKTKRRIVLTGYPLQNNLIEYWCMVDFVRPNFLGTKTEFCNMFERPIMNGQCADSTPQDVRLMRYRAHVLHSLLEGFVQRRGHTVLQAALPPKQEYVFMIRMSPVQRELYTKFMESITESGQNGWVNNNPLKAFSVCCKIWNHPDILYTCKKKSLDDNDLDIETGEPKKKGGRSRSKKETPPATPVPPTEGGFPSQTQPFPLASAASPAVPGLPNFGQPSMPLTGQSTGQPLPGSVTNQLPGQPLPGQPTNQLGGQTQTGPMTNHMPGQPLPGSMPNQSLPGSMPNQLPGQSQTGQLSNQLPGQTQTGQHTNQLPGQTLTGQLANQLPGQTQTGPMTNQLPGQIIGQSQVPSQAPPPSQSRSAEPSVTYDWANEILKDYVPGLLEHGGKMVLLFKLIKESLANDDKLLVFSQSLFTLNLIEEFLGRLKLPRDDCDEYWCKNKNYFRLDGSTASSEREKLINTFNYDPSKWLFLLSTRAGSLGVNLVGANRVVVMDASWNPCHDCQAICRVYRFGQTKPSYIYRLVTENTMERKIYDRQVNKQGMSDRVVDELNPQSQFRKEQVDKLLVHETKDYDIVDFSECDKEYRDTAMNILLKEEGHWLTGKPFTHESLLIDRKELKLTMREKRLAKQSYVMEKRLNVSYSRPSYAAYYPRSGQPPYQGIIRGRGVTRPIASVKPMVSTPVPMRPKIVAAPQILKPGVSVHQVLTTTEIVLPGTNTTTDAGATEPKRIPAGQQVLVIRTPKGVYIRTPDGKIFAVRSKPQPNSTSPLDTLANTGSNMSVTTAAGSRAVTIVRPNVTATTTTATVSLRNPSGVTVIRPAGVNATTKPLTIIRQGPGPVRTIIPVSLGNKGATSTTTTGSATSTGQVTAVTANQKLNEAIQKGAQIRIVTASADGKTGASSLSALQNLSEGKKIISNSPAFSGGGLVAKTSGQRPVIAVQNVKKVAGVSAPQSTVSIVASVSANTNTEQENKGPAPMDTSDKTDTNTDLKPIDLKALKLPQQFNPGNLNEKKPSMDNFANQQASAKPTPTSKTETKSSRTPKSKSRSAKNKSDSKKPLFSLSHSPSSSSLSEPSDSQSPKLNMNMSQPQQRPFSNNSSSLSTRPSDIDLHELQLSGNQNAVRPQIQQPRQQQVVPSTFTPGASMPSTSVQPSMNLQQGIGAQQGNMGTSGIANTIGNSSTSMDKNMSGISSSMSMSNIQQPQSNMGPPQQNRGIFNPGLPSASLKPTMSDPNFLSGQSLAGGNMQSGFMGATTSSNTNFSGSGLGGIFDGNTGYGAQGVQSQASGSSNNQNNSNDFLSEFNSIQNNSSFLSELNFSEADDSFLSQLGESSNHSSTSSSQGGQTTQTTNASVTNYFPNSSAPNFQTSSMGVQGFQQPQQQQQPNFNFDMFSNQQQQQQQPNTGFFPNFNNNQFQGNSGNFGTSQNMGMSQPGGFPGGSMYPAMGGMMQPGMYGYPAFPGYPYPPMMAPMPYYPMPFQPQYGAQGGNMGQPQAGSMNSQSAGMGMTPQGDSSFQSGSSGSSG